MEFVSTIERLVISLEIVPNMEFLVILAFLDNTHNVMAFLVRDSALGASADDLVGQFKFGPI